MTLERAGRLALRAAAASDLEGLRTALEARGQAAAALKTAPPSADVGAQFSAAVDLGEAIRHEIRALKLRVGVESARLTRIQKGLAAGLGSVGGRSRVDVSL
jgi:hypothetical protein